jgi:outer membrane receptor protein involved in Fe transport
MSAATALAADLQTQHAFRIPAQSLDTALLAFSDQAKVQVLMWANAQPDARSPGVSGDLTALAALRALLAKTGLAFQQIDTETVAIVVAGTSANPATGGSRAATPQTIRLAQADERARTTGATNTSSAQGSDPAPGASTAGPESLAEVVVTGTRILGAKQSAAVQSVGREQFRSQGSLSLQDVLRDIPAIFGGDYTGEATGAGQGGGITNNAYNRGRATAPNIHGLGAPATLSLLNGRRLPTSSNGYSVDVSMIPLLALQRVDVLADGASPIYGADAIAGVVNMITRRDEDAIETRVRIGEPTQPGYEQLQVGQTFGKRWDGGSAFIAYQYDEQEALRAYDRDRTSNIRFNTFVMPEQTQHAVFANIEQQITDSFKLGAEALWAKRDFAGNYSYFGGLPLDFAVEGDQYLAALTGELAINEDWTLASFAQFSGAQSEPLLLYGNPPAPVVSEKFEGEELTIGSTLSGKLFELAGRPVRAAFGAEYRDENRVLGGFGDGIKPFDKSRRNKAVFTEVQVPVLDSVDISAALRYDDYSDLGSTTNPKFGVRWEPAEGFALRGTYSTSFRALSLKDTYGQVSAGIYRPLPDPNTPGGTIVSLLINGNPSSDVKPEESDNYTVGIDYSPPQLPGLNIAATWFSVSYDGRLVSPNQAVTDLLNINLPDSAPFILRNPPIELLQELLSGVSQSGSIGGGPYTPAQVGVLIDNRFTNLSSSKVRGVDLDLLWNLRTAGPSFSFFSRTTFGLDYITKATPSVAEVDRVGRVYYPAKLRTRSGASVQHGIFHAGVALNYTDGFVDDRFTPRDPIASWTTFDINIGTDIGAQYGAFGGISLELVARNVTDKDPPYVRPTPVAPTDFPNYDSANASVVGRTLSLQMTKRW